MTRTRAPYWLRRFVTFPLLFAVGLAEWATGWRSSGRGIERLERWGTWRNP